MYSVLSLCSRRPKSHALPRSQFREVVLTVHIALSRHRRLFFPAPRAEWVSMCDEINICQSSRDTSGNSPPPRPRPRTERTNEMDKRLRRHWAPQRASGCITDVTSQHQCNQKNVKKSYLEEVWKGLSLTIVWLWGNYLPRPKIPHIAVR